MWSANVGRIKLQAASNAARGVTHRLGLNAHSDLTREEFRAAYLGAPMTLSDRSRQQEGKLAGTSSSRNDSPERLCVFGKVVRLVSTLLGRNTDQQAAIRKQQQVTEEHWRFENVSAPAAVDWRKHKPAVLGSIKDQHVNGTPCGSCWAFSAVSIMEIASAMATGETVWPLAAAAAESRVLRGGGGGVNAGAGVVLVLVAFAAATDPQPTPVGHAAC